MFLSRRERLIITVTLVVVALLVLDSYVVTPLRECCDRVAARKESLLAEMKRGHDLLARKREIGAKWREMIASGLKRDPAEAESQILHAVGDWAKDAGLKLSSVKPERQPDKRKLQEISFQASGTGSMNAISRFMWRLETSKVPIRVKDFQLGARREGTDDLTLQLRLSTLYQAPEPPASPTPEAAEAPSTSTGETE
jgi:Tfp pilus assembly protein PilO